MRIKRLQFGFAFAAAFACGAALAQAKDLIKITFDESREGEMAAGFSSVSGRWAVKKEKTPSGKFNSVLSQDQVFSGDGAAVAVLKKAGSVKDLSLQARVKMSKSGKGGSAGLVFRMRDASNMLALVLSIPEQNLSVRVLKNGKWSVLAQASGKFEPEVWYRLQVSLKDGRLACSLESQRVLQLRDLPILSSGEAGFVTLGETRADFDNLSLVSR